MPFTKADYVGAYTPSQLQTLKSTYNEVCACLNRCPKTDENREIVARAVISFYERGEKNPHQIAYAITHVEHLLI